MLSLSLVHYFPETVRKAIETMSQLDTTENLFKLDEFKNELAPGFVAALFQVRPIRNLASSKTLIFPLQVSLHSGTGCNMNLTHLKFCRC